jgi:hypothetical protein
MSLILSVIALIISVITAAWSIFSFFHQRHMEAVSSNTDLIVEIESRIGDVAEFLRFHGIENPKEELEKHALTPKEFAYLVNSFTVAGTFYRTTPFPQDILKKGSYRRTMCDAPATQRAWPLIRGFLADTPYRTALDEIFSDLNSRNT